MIKVFTKLPLKLFLLTAFLCSEGYCIQNTPNSVPDCTRLADPLNNATDVSVDSNITWNAVDGAVGYIVAVRSREQENLYALFSSENSLTFFLPFDLPENRQIYVQIFPYNENGSAEGCIEESFRTGPAISPPTCTVLTNPLANSTNVSIDTDISWEEVPNANGYNINIQNANGLNESFIINNETTFDLPFDLDQNETMSVLVVPFNSAGVATNCVAERFTTDKTSLNLPKYFTPNNDNINDIWIVPNSSNRVSCVDIFDRYGKLLVTLSEDYLGWDGTYNGNLVPSNDYWYIVKYKNGESYRGHFSLIR